MAERGSFPITAADPRIARGLLVGASSRKSSRSHAGQALAPSAAVSERFWLIPHTESCSIDLDLVNLTSKQRSSRPHQTSWLHSCSGIYRHASCNRNTGVFSSLVWFGLVWSLVPPKQGPKQKLFDSRIHATFCPCPQFLGRR